MELARAARYCVRPLRMFLLEWRAVQPTFPDLFIRSFGLGCENGCRLKVPVRFASIGKWICSMVYWWIIECLYFWTDDSVYGFPNLVYNIKIIYNIKICKYILSINFKIIRKHLTVYNLMKPYSKLIRQTLLASTLIKIAKKIKKKIIFRFCWLLNE